MFTYLYHLDSIGLDAEGVESALPLASWDMKFPTNADDAKWEASRFANQSSAPPDSNGYSDMTFVLLRRELTMLLHSLLPRLRTSSFEYLNELFQQAMGHLKIRYLQDLDYNQPIQKVVACYTNIFQAKIRLLLDHAHIRYERRGTADDEAKLVPFMSIIVRVSFADCYFLGSFKALFISSSRSSSSRTNSHHTTGIGSSAALCSGTLQL